HDGNAGVGPHEHETRVVGAAAHAVVAGAVAAAGDHGEFRHAGTGHGVDHLGAVFGNAFGLVFFADHKDVDVLQKEQRNTALVAQLEKVRALEGGLGKQNAVVGQDADRETMKAGKAGHQGGAVAGLEFVQLGAVDDAGDNFPRRHRLPRA